MLIVSVFLHFPAQFPLHEKYSLRKYLFIYLLFVSDLLMNKMNEIE